MDDTTKDIVSKERIHRTRVTVLQSTGKVKKTTLAYSDQHSMTFYLTIYTYACPPPNT